MDVVVLTCGLNRPTELLLQEHQRHGGQQQRLLANRHSAVNVTYASIALTNKLVRPMDLHDSHRSLHPGEMLAFMTSPLHERRPTQSTQW